MGEYLLLFLYLPGHQTVEQTQPMQTRANQDRAETGSTGQQWAAVGNKLSVERATQGSAGQRRAAQGLNGEPEVQYTWPIPSERQRNSAGWMNSIHSCTVRMQQKSPYR